MKANVRIEELHLTLTYEVPDDVEVGDCVLVPPMSYMSQEADPFEGTVTEIEGDPGARFYRGPCRSAWKRDA